MTSRTSASQRMRGKRERAGFLSGPENKIFSPRCAVADKTAYTHSNCVLHLTNVNRVSQAGFPPSHQYWGQAVKRLLDQFVRRSPRLDETESARDWGHLQWGEPPACRCVADPLGWRRAWQSGFGSASQRLAETIASRRLAPLSGTALVINLGLRILRCGAMVYRHEKDFDSGRNRGSGVLDRV